MIFPIILIFVLLAFIIVGIIIYILSQRGITSEEQYSYENEPNLPKLYDKHKKLTGFDLNRIAGVEDAAGFPDNEILYLYPDNAIVDTSGYWEEPHPEAKYCLRVNIPKNRRKIGINQPNKNARTDWIEYYDDNEKMERLNFENVEHKKMINSLNTFLNKQRLQIANDEHTGNWKLIEKALNIINKKESPIPDEEKEKK